MKRRHASTLCAPLIRNTLLNCRQVSAKCPPCHCHICPTFPPNLPLQTPGRPPVGQPVRLGSSTDPTKWAEKANWQTTAAEISGEIHVSIGPMGPKDPTLGGAPRSKRMKISMQLTCKDGRVGPLCVVQPDFEWQTLTIPINSGWLRSHVNDWQLELEVR